MKKFIATALLGLGLTMGATIASAQDNFVATITKVDGKVLVNTGDGFVPATEGMRLKPGDRVMLQDGGEANLKFDDECSRDLGEKRIVTVGGKSPCAGGMLAEQGLEPSSGGAIGGGTTGTGNGGVALMVGIVTAIDLWWLNEDDHEPENDVSSP